MPHKHTRKGEVDKSTIDLPPSQIAKPLPTSKSARENGVFTSNITDAKKSKKRKRSTKDEDDTPKAFLRLMAFQSGKKLPKGLDDGVKETKSARKRRLALEKEADGQAQGQDAVKVEEVVQPIQEVPTIRPGEKMSEFSARVDAALPVSGLINKTSRGGKDPLGLKVGRTKTEKKMHRMYDEWRAEEKRIQDKKMDALELAEEEAMDEDGQVKWKVDIEATSGQSKKAKKGKKRKVLGEVEDGEDDPWAKIQRDRGGKVAFNDIVQAPPTFTKVPREKFKVRGAGVDVGDVPKASGSLRRREELGEVRRSVVEGYREMMKSRGKAAE